MAPLSHSEYQPSTKKRKLNNNSTDKLGIEMVTSPQHRVTTMWMKNAVLGRHMHICFSSHKDSFISLTNNSKEAFGILSQGQERGKRKQQPTVGAAQQKKGSSPGNIKRNNKDREKGLHRRTTLGYYLFFSLSSCQSFVYFFILVNLPISPYNA